LKQVAAGAAQVPAALHFAKVHPRPLGRTPIVAQIWPATVQEPAPPSRISQAVKVSPQVPAELQTCDGQQSAAEAHARTWSLQVGGDWVPSQYQRVSPL
jgi:hypothetical protein